MFLERHQRKAVNTISNSLSDENTVFNYQDTTIVKPTNGIRKSIPLI